ncbi:SRPBCC family protein [Opitutus terrae]|uniref:Cyclase/dehydrase n=1 Tax=Opitutus terrae (strain DSM 11246 / JCM 15787 / PB90-1) TaxID=452637 RepID=B1ZNG3_OPITP|nr:SRPBCC family protein [Opitutus terrae]ACB74397.1 cyclase/dehydrase [Opitutus terrae PB90-1]
MTIHSLQTEFWLPEKRAQVFAFFGDALNLEVITPPWLRFNVLTPAPIEMRPGTTIAYRLRLHGLPLRWLTEITHWEPPVRFVDEQRRGPYRFWVHTHTFREQGGGTLCRDQVDYAVPGGAWVDRLFVRPQLESIFAYRERALKIRFPQTSATAGR